LFLSTPSPTPYRLPNPPQTAAAPRRGPAPPCAISRQRKEDVVKTLVAGLDGSTVAMAMNYSGVTVADLQKLRRQLPAGATLYVAKNTLMGQAVAQSAAPASWEALKGQGGQNAWVFIPEEVVSKTVKAYLDWDKAMKKSNPDGPDVSIRVGVMDGAVLSEKDTIRLKDLPTKEDLYTKIAVGVKAVPTKVARGVKEVPTKLARAIAAVADLDDDKTKTVASVAK